MKRFLSGLLCLILCLSLFWGCAKGKPEQPVETDEAIDTEEIVDTAETEPVETEPVTDEDDIAASLVGVRQAMIGTPAMAAVAYLGATDSMESVNTMEWLGDLLPGFLSDLPFITAIDEDHIIGDRYGELYLVVPCDENASVAINHVDKNDEVTEVIYRSDHGDPVLVFANNTGYPSDTQINIVDNEGNVLTYYPVLNDLYYLTQYSDGSIFDLSPYTEILHHEYTEYQDYSWKLPEKVDIVDTSWDTSYMLSDGSMSSYHISFAPDGVYIQWNGGSLSAPWETVTKDGVCMLRLYPDTDDERSFCMLLSTDHDYIYLSQDFVNDAVRCDEPISLMLERTYG
ncbi:MAG: hypothetical protein IJB24_06215 [Clostridia bacterium]|nr:hypothetical protein [Clostridia bacterium]